MFFTAGLGALMISKCRDFFVPSMCNSLQLAHSGRRQYGIIQVKK